jgi:hypothetical protein
VNCRSTEQQPVCRLIDPGDAIERMFYSLGSLFVTGEADDFQFALPRNGPV